MKPFPKSRIFEHHDKMSVMEHRLQVIAAYQINDMVSGKGAMDEVKRELATYKLPDGNLHPVFCSAPNIVGANGRYDYLDNAGKDLQARSVKSNFGPTGKRHISLISQPTLFTGTGMYRFYIHEELIPDYVALHQYYEQLGGSGSAYLLNTEYRRRMYYHFSQRPGYTDINYLLGDLLKCEYKKADGTFDFGQAKKRILDPTIQWLYENTDMEILPGGRKLEDSDYKKSTGKRIEGIYTTDLRNPNRKPDVLTEKLLCPIINIMNVFWLKAGLSSREAGEVADKFSINQQDFALVEFHKHYKPGSEFLTYGKDGKRFTAKPGLIHAILKEISLKNNPGKIGKGSGAKKLQHA